MLVTDVVLVASSMAIPHMAGHTTWWRCTVLSLLIMMFRAILVFGHQQIITCVCISVPSCAPEFRFDGSFPRGAPSKGAKLCTYLRWFARPDRSSTEPYYELPLPVTKLRSIFQFRVGAHSLPVEQGRIQMPKVPRHLRRCTFCATTTVGDERHCVFDCPPFQGLRLQHAEIFRDSHDAMRSIMWHKDQKSVCALVLAIVNEAQTL